MRGARTWAAVLLVVGFAQMLGDVLGWTTLKALGAATQASPAPHDSGHESLPV